ncbi:MAG: DUF1553 domain-containing protein, partial [Lentisphaeraceae bacterium]|nr:DUF1553 domain-containing protein [Lentisphaeraceae bacterium]
NTGKSFGASPQKTGDIILFSEGKSLVQTVTASKPVAGLYSSRQGGALRTPDFIIDENISLYVKGKNASVSLIVRNYEQAGKGATTRGLRVEVDNDNWQKVSFHTRLWKGEKAYLEILQNGGSIKFIQNDQYSYKHNENSYVSVKGYSGIDEHGVWHDFQPTSIASLSKSLGKHVERIFKKWSTSTLNNDEAEFLSSLLKSGLLENRVSNTPELQKLVEQYRQLAQEIPKPVYTRSLVDGTPQNESVYIRGNHKTLSIEENPRHFLDGINSEPFVTAGSGRLEWAKALIQQENPLTARVIVNRLWHHIFGRGLVYSTNNFGKLGSLPTHPELLDYLAQDFMASGWSMKKMIRKMVLSSSYRMSSDADPKALVADPENNLLQHISARRMTAEMVRDNVLLTTGSLDRTLYGPSIPANVKGMPGSRAAPRHSGPLDGANRRSVYQELRRNYLPPFFMAFDMPNATESIGRRNITNVPAQSLVMLNDPFIQDQAKRWATKYAADSQSFDVKINKIHQEAFSRPVTQIEREWAKQTFKDLAQLKKSPENSIRVWQEFCHMMLNRKEFIYLF